jgi:hypothetical protein
MLVVSALSVQYWNDKANAKAAEKIKEYLSVQQPTNF